MTNVNVWPYCAVLPPFPSHEEFLKVHARCLKGDERAQREVVLRYAKLVLFFARRWQRMGTSMAFDDWCHEGMIGLLRAVQLYKQENGSFTPYVRSSINFSMKRALRSLDRVVRVPSVQQDRLGLIKRVERDFLLRQGRPPSLSDLERALPHLSREQIEWALASDLRAERPSSRRDDGLTPEQLVPDNPADWPEALVAAREERERVWEAFEESGLTDREKTVVRLRFGLDDDDPKSRPKIGRVIGMSRETPRLDEESGLGKMRELWKSLHGDP